MRHRETHPRLSAQDCQRFQYPLTFPHNPIPTASISLIFIRPAQTRESALLLDWRGLVGWAAGELMWLRLPHPDTAIDGGTGA